MDEESLPAKPVGRTGVTTSASAAAGSAAHRAPLEEALRTGPFDTALRIAIATRGLSLESLRRRLQAEGIEISLASLSYWQHGVRRPERADSLRAVRALERTLGLPGASLVALLGPPRPRGRRRGEAPPAALGFEDTIGPELGLSDVLSGLDPAVNHRYEHLSMQGERWLDAHRSWYCERSRRIVRANEDGLDRFVAVCTPDSQLESLPKVEPVSGCRLGRTRIDADGRFQASELIFDQVLRAGQIHVFEYEYRAGGLTNGVAVYLCGSRQPIREFVLRSHFDRDCIPARCYHMRRARYCDPFQVAAELRPGGTGTVTLVALDNPPGIDALVWEWD